MRLLKEIRTLMANYHVKSGIYHYYRNEFKQAVDFFHKALRDELLSDSEQKTAHYYLTQTFMNSAERFQRKGDLEAAAGDYRRAAEVSPRYPDIRYRLGKVLEAQGSTREAVEEYRRAVSINPEYLEARIALAFCLLRSGRDREAASAFEQAADLKVRRIRVPVERGLGQLRTGLREAAEEAFHEAFLSFPLKFAERYESALEYLRAEEYEGALRDLDQALELNPKFADLHNFRGVALCELGRTQDGIEAFRKSVELSGDFVVPRLNLAFALLRIGDYKQAEAELEMIHDQDPTQHAATVKLEELRTGSVRTIRRAAPRGGLTS